MTKHTQLITVITWGMINIFLIFHVMFIVKIEVEDQTKGTIVKAIPNLSNIDLVGCLGLVGGWLGGWDGRVYWEGGLGGRVVRVG